MLLPGLYAIADTGFLASRGIELREYAEGLLASGVKLIQLRDKAYLPQEVLRSAAALAETCASTRCLLIMNDRADFAALAGFDGVHVGQRDLSPEDAKTVLASAITPIFEISGSSRRWSIQGVDGIVGVSTHTDAELIAATAGAADYVAIGPVFATGTKLDAAAVVGLEGVRRARSLTSKPLVAIGGITRENARSVIDAGADSVAVISGLMAAGEAVEKVARDFMELLG